MKRVSVCPNPGVATWLFHVWIVSIAFLYAPTLSAQSFWDDPVLPEWQSLYQAGELDSLRDEVHTALVVGGVTGWHAALTWWSLHDLAGTTEVAWNALADTPQREALAPLYHARLLRQEGRPGEVVAAWSAGELSYEHGPLVALEVASAYRTLGRVREALELLVEAIGRWPDVYVLIWSTITDIGSGTVPLTALQNAFEDGRIPAGSPAATYIAEYTRLTDPLPEDHVRMVRNWLVMVPNDADAMRRLTSQLNSLHRFKESAAVARRLDGLHGDLQIASVWTPLVRTGGLVEAEEMIDRHAALCGDNTERCRLELLAQGHRVEGNRGEARRLLEAAPSAWQEVPSIRHQWALLEQADGRFDEAIEWAVGALRQEPTLSRWKLVIDLHKSRNDADEVEAGLAELQTWAGHWPDWAWAASAWVIEQRETTEAACDVWHQAHEALPEARWIMHMRAECLHDDGDLVGALTLVEASVALDPSHNWPQQKWVEWAPQEARAAIQRHPRAWELRVKLASRADAWTQQAEQWQQLLLENPQSATLRRAAVQAAWINRERELSIEWAAEGTQTGAPHDSAFHFWSACYHAFIILDRSTSRTLSADELSVAEEALAVCAQGRGDVAELARDRARLGLLLERPETAVQWALLRADLTQDCDSPLSILFQFYASYLRDQHWRRQQQCLDREPMNTATLDRFLNRHLLWGGSPVVALAAIAAAVERGAIAENAMAFYRARALEALGDPSALAAHYLRTISISASDRYLSWFDASRRDANVTDTAEVTVLNGRSLPTVSIRRGDSPVVIRMDSPLNGRVVELAIGAAWLRADYDNLGQLVSLSSSTGKSIQISYRKFKVASLVPSDGAPIHVSYNAEGRATEVHVTGLGRLKIEYRNGQISSVEAVSDEEGDEDLDGVLALRINQYLTDLAELTEAMSDIDSATELLRRTSSPLASGEPLIEVPSEREVLDSALLAEQLVAQSTQLQSQLAAHPDNSTRLLAVYERLFRLAWHAGPDDPAAQLLAQTGAAWMEHVSQISADRGLTAQFARRWDRIAGEMSAAGLDAQEMPPLAAWSNPESWFPDLIESARWSTRRLPSAAVEQTDAGSTMVRVSDQLLLVATRQGLLAITAAGHHWVNIRPRSGGGLSMDVAPSAGEASPVTAVGRDGAGRILLSLRGSLFALDWEQPENAVQITFPEALINPEPIVGIVRDTSRTWVFSATDIWRLEGDDLLSGPSLPGNGRLMRFDAVAARPPWMTASVGQDTPDWTNQQHPGSGARENRVPDLDAPLQAGLPADTSRWRELSALVDRSWPDVPVEVVDELLLLLAPVPQPAPELLEQRRRTVERLDRLVDRWRQPARSRHLRELERTLSPELRDDPGTFAENRLRNRFWELWSDPSALPDQLVVDLAEQTRQLEAARHADNRLRSRYRQDLPRSIRPRPVMMAHTDDGVFVRASDEWQLVSGDIQCQEARLVQGGQEMIMQCNGLLQRVRIGRDPIGPAVAVDGIPADWSPSLHLFRMPDLLTGEVVVSVHEQGLAFIAYGRATTQAMPTIPLEPGTPLYVSGDTEYSHLQMMQGEQLFSTFMPEVRFPLRGRVNDILYDPVRDVTWIATANDGLWSRDREGNFTYFADYVVDRMILAPDGTLFLNHRASILRLLPSETQPRVIFETDLHPEMRGLQISVRRVRGLTLAADGTLWVAAGASVYRWTPEAGHDAEEYAWIQDSTAYELPTSMVSQIVETVDGDILAVGSAEGHIDHRGVALRGGLARWDGQGFRRHSLPATEPDAPALATFFIFDITRLGDGTAILGTNEGFMLQTSNGNTPFWGVGNESYDALRETHPALWASRAGSQLSDGSWLFPTAGGVVRYHDGNWSSLVDLRRHFPEATRLGEQGAWTAHALAVTPDQHLLVGNDHGLVEFDLQQRPELVFGPE